MRTGHRARRALLATATFAASIAALGCPDPRRAASASAPADSVAGEVPFQLVGPGGAAIAVSVRVNGREPVNLILDTGATLTCVDSAYAREIALPPERGVVGAAVGVGGAGRVQLHRADSLQVGAARATGLTICATDLAALRSVSPDVRGLLGLNFLRSFRVTLDFARNVMVLTRA